MFNVTGTRALLHRERAIVCPRGDDRHSYERAAIRQEVMGESGRKNLRIVGRAYMGVPVSACLNPDLRPLLGAAA